VAHPIPAAEHDDDDDPANGPRRMLRLLPGRIDHGGDQEGFSETGRRRRGEAMRGKRRGGGGTGTEMGELGGGNATMPYAFLTVAVSGLGTARWRSLACALWPGGGGWVI
jgi:hypothetical protein